MEMAESNNSMNYSFSDFTVKQYRELLKKTKSQAYRAIGYNEHSISEKWVIWRHDIDFSPQRALAIARIEHEEDIKSTYFILPHSRFYNLFEKECTDLIFEIQNLGHTIGLHFDCAYFNINRLDQEKIEDKVQLEKVFLEKVFETQIDCFSFHSPQKWAVDWGVNEVSGCINAYSEFFMNEVGYASDSNGIWRNESILSRIEEGLPKLQLLTHPVWWTDEVSSPKDRFLRAVNGRSDALITQHQKHWGKIGRPLIDW